MNTANDFERRVIRSIAGLEERKVTIGISGGADSVALFRVLLACHVPFTAVHCNFHLRGQESDRDQHFVEDLCEKYGVSLQVCHYDTRKYASDHGISIEMAARELRYRDFERIMQETGSNAICIAHHRDDCIETVLMNLMRGTGIKGLTGIRPVNGHILRPLLCVSRAEIESYLQELGQPFVTDSTNLEADCTRNMVRLQLLPLMRRISAATDQAIADTALHMQQALAFYEQAVAESAARVSTVRDGILSIDIKALKAVASPQALLYEILSPYGFNSTQSDAIFRSLDAAPGRLFRSATHTAVKDRDTVDLCALEEDFSATVSPVPGSVLELPYGQRLTIDSLDAGSAIPTGPRTATIDADLLKGSLTVRNWREGDRFVPFGMKGSRLVSDYMTDLKFSLLQKKAQLVVCNGDDIVWVVGHRSDNRYRITERTIRRITVTLE